MTDQIDIFVSRNKIEPLLYDSDAHGQQVMQLAVGGLKYNFREVLEAMIAEINSLRAEVDQIKTPVENTPT